MIDWYLPGFKAGGPIKSVSAIVQHLKNDFDFYIITTNSDIGEEKAYDTIESDKWITLTDNVKIFYFSKKHLSFLSMFKTIHSVSFDRLYINSFFSRYFSIYPLLYSKIGKIKKEIILAPRGMLGRGALQIKKRKKIFFIKWSKFFRLHKNITWHSTSLQETGEIRSLFGANSNIKLAPNLSILKDSGQFQKKEKQPGKIKMIFLSRISEKKNLLFAIELLIRAENYSEIIFDIYGPIEDKNYWEKCLVLLKNANKNILITFFGELKAEKVSNILMEYHFLILPTKNENFGHVILEAFAAGCPVIISDQTPWRNLMEQNCGWDISLNEPEKFREAIEQATLMNQEEYSLWSQSAFDSGGWPRFDSPFPANLGAWSSPLRQPRF